MRRLQITDFEAFPSIQKAYLLTTLDGISTYRGSSLLILFLALAKVSCCTLLMYSLFVSKNDPVVSSIVTIRLCYFSNDCLASNLKFLCGLLLFCFMPRLAIRFALTLGLPTPLGQLRALSEPIVKLTFLSSPSATLCAVLCCTVLVAIAWARGDESRPWLLILPQMLSMLEFLMADTFIVLFGLRAGLLQFFDGGPDGVWRVCISVFIFWQVSKQVFVGVYLLVGLRDVRLSCLTRPIPNVWAFLLNV